MANPVTLAKLRSDFRRVPGLRVRGNLLTGTLCVTFDGERGVSYDKERILAYMRRVNRRMANGYGICLNIREENFVEEWLYSSYATIKIYVLRSLMGTKCDGASACYDSDVNVMRVTPEAPDIYIVHELFHKLGLFHSGSPKSVMYWNQGARPSRDIRTFPEEIKMLVDAYR